MINLYGDIFYNSFLAFLILLYSLNIFLDFINTYFQILNLRNTILTSIIIEESSSKTILFFSLEILLVVHS